MPHLSGLSLFGYFEITSKVKLPKLKTLHLESDDFCTGINGGAISHETLINLLSSSFPELLEAYNDYSS